ncbi:MAG: hypothetical protein AB7O91_10035 [Sphingomonas sp.]
MSKLLRTAACCGLLLAAAGFGPAQEARAPAGEAGAELRDQTLRIHAIGGMIVNTLYLDADGSLRLQEEPDGAERSGRWFVREQRLCLEWQPRGRECWPYLRTLVRGQPVEVTSDRGMRVTVTLI